MKTSSWRLSKEMKNALTSTRSRCCRWWSKTCWRSLATISITAQASTFSFRCFTFKQVSKGALLKSRSKSRGWYSSACHSFMTPKRINYLVKVYHSSRLPLPRWRGWSRAMSPSRRKSLGRILPTLSLITSIKYLNNHIATHMLISKSDHLIRF